MKKILDSGNRTEFKSGAVRDIQDGNGKKVRDSDVKFCFHCGRKFR